MFEVNVTPDLDVFIAQIISTVLFLIFMGVCIYFIVLAIKALKIYIKKNSQ